MRPSPWLHIERTSNLLWFALSPIGMEMQSSQQQLGSVCHGTDTMLVPRYEAGLEECGLLKSDGQRTTAVRV